MEPVLMTVLVALAVVAAFVASLFAVVWVAGRSGRREQVRRFGEAAAPGGARSA